MKARRLLASGASLLTFATLTAAPQAVSATEISGPVPVPAPTPQLVALGDSITFGWNMADTNGNTAPSHSAFPALLAQAHGYDAINLGKGGWTSDDLLKALQTDTTFQSSVKKAKLVTLDIGSNDLLSLAQPLLTAAANGQTITLSPADLAKFTAAIQHFSQTLPAIIAAVKAQTDAPILLYTVYNPFPDNTQLNAITEQMVTTLNGIIQGVGAKAGAQIVDAYAAFNHHQLDTVRVKQNDVHPTLVGQYVLAQATENTLDGKSPVSDASHGKAKYAITLNGINVNDSAAHTVKVGQNWTLYSSVDEFAKVYGAAVSYDKKSQTLLINGSPVNPDYGRPRVEKGVLTAPTLGMARAYIASRGGGMLDSGWISSSGTTNVTVLPKGYVKASDVVPQMGMHWVNPALGTYGLIFGTYQGKLVFEEYMYDSPDAWTTPELGVQFLKDGLPVPKIDHFEFDPQPNGHPGFEFPHTDEHMYFITPTEQAAIK